MLLESNAASVRRLRGLLSSSQTSLSYTQSHGIPPSGHLRTAGSSRNGCEMYHEKKGPGETPLKAKQQLTNQAAQFGLLVFSSVITSASATFIAKGLAIDTSSSGHYHQGLRGKDEHPSSSKDSAPVGTCMLSCYPNSKLPFHSPHSLHAKSSFYKLSNITLTFTLLKMLNLCICSLGTKFF